MITFLTPYCRSAIWGGSRLTTQYKTDLPNLAEAWVYSVLSGQSSVTLDGIPLCDHLKHLGLAQDVIVRQPLIKYIDTNDLLSVQVHPDDAYAQQIEGQENGKTEMWYILHAEPDAFVYMDLATSRASFLQALQEGKPEQALKKVYVKEGDVFFIPPGMVHALGKGITLLEVQQPSDLTYRLWDYQRPDAEGNLRPLHTEKALAVLHTYQEHELKDLQFSLFAKPANTQDSHLKMTSLALTPYFSVEIGTCEDTPLPLALPTSPACLLVLSGEGALCENEIAYPIKTGDSILLCDAKHITISGHFRFALVFS